MDVAGSGSCPVAAFDTAVLNSPSFAAIVLVTLSWGFSSRYCDLATGQTAGDRGYVPTGTVRRDAHSLLFNLYRVLYPLVKTMISHLHLMQRLSTRGVVHPLLCMPSWHGA